MTMDPAKEIEKRTKALCKTINSALASHYKKAKMKDAKKMISTKMAAGAAAKARTPEQQAALVLKGTSWTCNSGHMGDGARHVAVFYGGKRTWDLKGIKKKDKDAYAVFAKAFQDGMNKQKLLNFGRGKTALPPGDALHVELPDSRLKDSDKRVLKCLQVYADATRLKGKKKNTSYESSKGSKFQKEWLKAYDAKLAKKKK